MTDPRIQNLIKVTDPTGRQKVAGTWRGERSGTLHSNVLKTVGAIDSFLNQAHDIRMNRNFGPVEAGQRMRSVSGPTLKAINEIAISLGNEKAMLRSQVHMLNPVKDYKDCGHWQAQFDLRLIDWFNTLPIAKKAMVEREMRESPVLHLELAEAIQRVPRPLAGVDESSRAEIRVELSKVFKAAEFAALDERIEQLTVAENALHIGIKELTEAIGSKADLIEHAPEAFKYAISDEGSRPIAWIPQTGQTSGMVAAA